MIIQFYRLYMLLCTVLTILANMKRPYGWRGTQNSCASQIPCNFSPGSLFVFPQKVKCSDDVKFCVRVKIKSHARYRVGQVLIQEYNLLNFCRCPYDQNCPQNFRCTHTFTCLTNVMFLCNIFYMTLYGTSTYADVFLDYMSCCWGNYAWFIRR